MTRILRFACLSLILSLHAGAAFQQAPPAPASTPQKPNTQGQEPPEEGNVPEEEDESVAPEKYVLNPLESDRNVRVGNYYWHKGKFQAALQRYERATRYNPSSAEAFFKVGEAEDKLKNKDAAKIAYRKVVDLAPDSKLGHEAKKKIGNKS